VLAYLAMAQGLRQPLATGSHCYTLSVVCVRAICTSACNLGLAYTHNMLRSSMLPHSLGRVPDSLFREARLHMHG
jgi:hypothetical protein